MRCDVVGVLISSPWLLMGARTSNRKRDDECLSLNRSYWSLRSPDFHVSKKPKFSTMPSDRPVVSSNSTVARLSRYPEETSQLRREVHGPCRILKFGLSKSLYRFWESKNGDRLEQDEAGDDVGNILSYNYRIAKSRAIGALRCLSKDKEVIDLDSDTQTERGASEDSKTEEEVEVIEVDKQDGRSMFSDQRPLVQELDVKMLDVHQPSSSYDVIDLKNDSSKMENAEKMLGALSLERDMSSVSAYKKLLQSVEKRTSRLRSLDFEIELNEKRRLLLQSQTPKKKPLDVRFFTSIVFNFSFSPSKLLFWIMEFHHFSATENVFFFSRRFHRIFLLLLQRKRRLRLNVHSLLTGIV